MYPTVTVKGLSGLLVVLLVFSEVHSFIFEDEGGTEFCSKIDNSHRNESTKKWLESSCDGSHKIDSGDRSVSLRNYGTPREDFGPTSVPLDKGKIPQKRHAANSREQSAGDQVRREISGRIRTTLPHESYNTDRKFIGSDNGKARRERSSNRESRRIEVRSVRVTDIRAAKLREHSAIEYEKTRTTRLLEKRSAESDKNHSTRLDIVRSRSNENRLVRSDGNRDIRFLGDPFDELSLENNIRRRVNRQPTRISENSNTRSDNNGIARSLDDQAIRSSEIIRVSRSSENRFAETLNTRHIRSDGREFVRSLDNREIRFNGIRAIRSFETRVMRLGENRSTRFDNIETASRSAGRATRSDTTLTSRLVDTREAIKEIRSTRSNGIQSKSTNNPALTLNGNRFTVSITERYTESGTNGATRYLENRVAVSGDNPDRFVDTRATRLDHNRLRRSQNIRMRELNNRAIRSNEISSTRSYNIRASNGNHSAGNSDTRYIRSARNAAIRSLGNDVDSSNVDPPVRSIEGKAENRPARSKVIRSSRSLDNRSTTAEVMRATRSDDIRASRLNRDRSTRSVDTLYIRSNDNGAIRFATSDKIRVARSVDRRRIAILGENRLTRSNDIGSRSVDNLALGSNENRSYRFGAIRPIDHSILPEEKRDMDIANIREKRNDKISSRRREMFPVETGRRQQNNGDQSLENRKSEEFNIRRSITTENNSRRENFRIVRNHEQRNNFIDGESEKRSIRRSVQNGQGHNSKIENFSRREITIMQSSRFNGRGSESTERSSRYGITENSLQRSVQQTSIRSVRRIPRETGNISRNSREFQRVVDVQRRSPLLILSKKSDSQSVFQERREDHLGMEENSRRNERYTRSVDSRRETRRNFVFVRSGGSRFERIRKFGNDKRQRQNSRMRIREHIGEKRARKDIREILLMTNRMSSVEKRKLSIAPSGRISERLRFDENYRNIRRIHDHFNRKTVDNATPSSYVFGQRVLLDGRIITQWKDAATAPKNRENLMRRNDHRNSREGTNFVLDGKARYRMEVRKSTDNRVLIRSVTGYRGSVTSVRESFNLRRTEESRTLDYNVIRNRQISRKTKRYNTRNESIRTIDYIREKQDLDGYRKMKNVNIRLENNELEPYNIFDHGRVVNRGTTTRSNNLEASRNRFVTERVASLNLRKKTEFSNTARFGTLRKQDDEDYVLLKERVVGISSNGALQLTLAAILVGQLIFFKIGNFKSKRSYIAVNWIKKMKSF